MRPPAQKNSSGAGGQGRGVRFGRWHSRVRSLPEVYGELPVAALAEEIDTPGEGRVRALVTVAGNPLVSTPNSDRLERAARELDFMLSIDIYVNETTRHADVVLPAPEPLEKSHYDLALYQLATRNVANYSPPVFEGEGPAEWEVMLRLAGIVSGQGAGVDVEALDLLVIQTLIQRELATAGSRVAGRDPAELLEALEPRRGPERVLDFMLRVGPYGDALRRRPGRPVARACSSATRTASTSARSSRDCRTCCARRRGRSSWPRRRSSPTSSGCAARSRASRTACC